MQHAELEEQVILLAAGALAPVDAETVRRHMRECPECAGLLAEYESVGQALLHQVPPEEPPRELEARVRARLRRESPAGQPNRPRRFWAGTFTLPRWAGFGLAAALLLVLLGGALWIQRLTDPRYNESLQVAQVLNSPSRVTTELGTTDLAPEARGYLVLEPNASAAILTVYEMKQLPSDKAYQIWLIHDGKRDTGGLFTVDSSGGGVVLIRAPQPFRAYQQVGITVEPATGSPGPTTPRVMGGKLQ
jgi:anti-sigma-K factor RskA